MATAYIPVGERLSFSWRAPVGGYAVGVVTLHAATRDRDDVYLVEPVERTADYVRWYVFKFTGPADQEPYRLDRLADGSMVCGCKAATASHQACRCRHKLLIADGLETGELT